jgi:two-component system phosphate regulon sensor histidine kinase PhoR
VRRKRLLYRFFPLLLAISLVSLLAASWLATRTIRRLYLTQAEEELASAAKLIRIQVEDHFSQYSPGALDSLAKQMGRTVSMRITFIAPDGVVLGDSHDDPAIMENHADRPEIKQAIASGFGASTRYSPTLRQRMFYVALPLERAEGVVGIVRVAIPADVTQKTLKTIYASVALTGLIIALFTAFFIFLIFKSIRDAMLKLQQGAARFAQGDLERPLALPEYQELGDVADALNQMGRQLHERIQAITQQRNELDAVLSSMVEGVLAVDLNERVLKINRAAAAFLHTSQEEAQGHNLQEVVLIPDFQRFVRKVLEEKANAEAEFATERGSRFLSVHGTLLRDAENREIGALVVFNDVTRLRRLENLRKEFAANVSHELRTPLTSIKGFVETLREGALESKEDALRFLEIIAEQIDRLNAIIEDLLKLSSLEKETEGNGIRLQVANLRTVIDQAAAGCRSRIAEKDLSIQCEAPEEIPALINPTLLEQALLNLLDNAISYSPPHSVIHIGAETGEDEIILYVRDHGIGIPAEHLPRIFERFYRVDKTRNRKSGGTGLGLAIVKHIALAHRGRVSVESEPGKGSVFRIHLPRTEGSESQPPQKN